MTNEERKAALEAIIYAADEPATIEQLASALGEEKIVVQTSLDELVASYAAEERGIEIRGVAGGYKMYTKAQHHDVVRRFIKSLRPPLSNSLRPSAKKKSWCKLRSMSWSPATQRKNAASKFAALPATSSSSEV